MRRLVSFLVCRRRPSPSAQPMKFYLCPTFPAQSCTVAEPLLYRFAKAPRQQQKRRPGPGGLGRRVSYENVLDSSYVTLAMVPVEIEHVEHITDCRTVERNIWIFVI